MLVKVKKLIDKAKLPTRAHDGDSGFDLYSADLEPGQWLRPHGAAAIPTGLAFEIPPCWRAEVRTKSSQALKGISVDGGIIDQGYRGEVSVILHNVTDVAIWIESGSKIGQLIFMPCYADEVTMLTTDKLGPSERGERGFGSTGG